MAVLYTPHFIQFFDDNGDPLAAGKLYTYAAGTTTPKATYTTAAGAASNANPVVLDSAGRAVVFLDGSYKFRLETAASVLVREVDNVSAFTTSAVTIDAILPTQTGNAGKFLTTNGTAASWGAGSSGLVPIATTTVSTAVATVDFVHGTGGVVFDGTYKGYVLEILEMFPSSSGADFQLRVSTNLGSTYMSSAGSYMYGFNRVDSSSASIGDLVSISDAKIPVTSLGSDTLASGTAGVYAQIIFPNPASTNHHLVHVRSGNAGTTFSTIRSHFGTGVAVPTASPINAFRIFANTGNIAAGTFKLYGMA